MKGLNHVAIERTNDEECPAHFYFNDVLDVAGYIFIDIEQTAQKIGRDIIDDNDDVNDICSEEVYSWVGMLTDEITKRIKEEVWDYIERNS